MVTPAVVALDTYITLLLSEPGVEGGKGSISHGFIGCVYILFLASGWLKVSYLWLPGGGLQSEQLTHTPLPHP